MHKRHSRSKLTHAPLPHPHVQVHIFWHKHHSCGGCSMYAVAYSSLMKSCSHFAASVDMEIIADDCAAVAHAVTDHRRALLCTTSANVKSPARVHVFGVSMGGFVAQLLALRHPDIVVSLALGCSHFGGPNHAPTSKEYVSMINDEPPREPKDPWLAFMRRSLAMNFAPGFVTSHPQRFEK